MEEEGRAGKGVSGDREDRAWCPVWFWWRRGRERSCGMAVFTRNFPGGSAGKEPACRVGNPPAGWETLIQLLRRDDPLEKG